MDVEEPGGEVSLWACLAHHFVPYVEALKIIPNTFGLHLCPHVLCVDFRRLDISVTAHNSLDIK